MHRRSDDSPIGLSRHTDGASTTRPPYIPPSTATERGLAEFWSTLLSLNRVGRHDHFFDLGGSDLHASRMLDHVAQHFGVDLDLSILNQCPRLAAFADAIDQTQAELDAHDFPPLEPRPRHLPAPLSFAQERMWFLDKFEPGSSAYNVSVSVRLLGYLDLALMARCSRTVYERHEILNSHFPTDKATPVQFFAFHDHLPVPVIDLSALNDEDAAAVIESCFSLPFDLGRDPLFRIHWFRLAPDRHKMLLCMHHIIGDDWSLGLVFREICALYADIQAGSRPTLKPLPFQYADFAFWQRNWLRGEILDKQLTWWRDYLAGASSLLELPLDMPRPEHQTHRGDEIRMVLPHADVARFVQFCDASKSPLLDGLLAAYFVLLGRCSGQSDMCVGMTVPNRHHPDTKDLIGFFENTLVLRAQLEAVSNFEDLLDQVRHMKREASAHQDVPFEKVVDCLSSGRDLSHNPLFMTSFAMVTNDVLLEEGASVLDQVTVYGARMGRRVAQVDLTLFAQRRDGQLVLDLNFNTDLFATQTAQLLIELYRDLLQLIPAHAQQPLHQLPLVNPAQRASILRQLCDDRTPFSQDTVHLIFEQIAARYSDRIAIREVDGASITYGQLDQRANQLARFLRAKGVVADEPVAIRAERNIPLITGFLGILKAGGAYLPLDPGFPKERLHFMLEDCAVRVLLTRRDLFGVEHKLAHVLALDDADDVLQSFPTSPLGLSGDPMQRIYIIYTSGSTGMPKGVSVPHAGVVRLVMEPEYVQLGPDEVILQTCSISFDVATFEIWGALLHGGQLVLIKPGDLDRLGSVIRDYDITTMWLTAQLFTIAVEDHLEDLARLRQLLAGGDALSPAHVKACLSRFETTRMINGYGPTEATTFASSCNLSKYGLTGISAPIGKPITSTSCLVLDTRLNLVPHLVVGQLYLGGVGLARGYQSRPALTASRFVPNPYASNPGERIYATGDLVRLLANGLLEFLGRADFQVKLRGFRIELGEIESLLTHLDGVKDAMVLLDERDGDKQLVAHVVREKSEKGGRLSPEMVRDHLANKLPTFMVPGGYLLHDAWPVNRSGKIDRAALKAMTPLKAGRVAFLEPQTSTEEIVAALWQRVLGLARVGRHDDFFALGGHSLLATRVASRVNKTFGVRVALPDFFEYTTLSRFCEHLDQMLSQNRLPADTGTIPKRNQGDWPLGLPLSFGQERLWLLHQIEETGGAYAIPVAIRLQGPLDQKILRLSLQDMVDRHEVLRTCFRMYEGRPVQVILPEVDLHIDQVNLSDHDDALAEAHRLLAKTDHTFDLTFAPLMKLVLYQLGKDDHLLFLNIHHIISDGWTMRLIMSELVTFYLARYSGTTPALPELPIQYGDFAIWQRGLLDSPIMAQQLGYWEQKLADVPSRLDLPTDYPRPASQSFAGRQYHFYLGERLGYDMEQLCHEEGITTFMGLLSVYSVLLARYAGVDQLVIGSPIANRNREEVEELIGFFVNTLALHVDLFQCKDFAQLFARVRQTALEAYAHQDAPFERVVERVQTERDMSRSALFQAVFALETHDLSRGFSMELPSGLIFAMDDADFQQSRFDLTLFVIQRGDGYHGVLEYCTALFSEKTVAQMANHFRKLLHELTQQGSACPIDTPLMEATERQNLLASFDQTHHDLPEPRNLVELFENTARRRGDALAVIEESGSSISYRALDERANCLAHLLIEKGLRSEETVGLQIVKGIDILVAIIAIQKAGGVVLALDPNFPEDRLIFMIEDSKARLLITLEGELPVSLPHTETISLKEVGQDNTHRPKREIHPEQLAYLIYTSGSTGNPKAVALHHLGILTLVFDELMDLDEDEVMLQINSFSFDASYLEMWNTFRAGARLAMFTSARLERLGAFLLEHHVRTLFITTQLFNLMVDDQIEGLAQVRELLTGGEAMSRGHASRFMDKHPHVQFYNVYGPTETSCLATRQRLTPAAIPPTSLPIGNVLEHRAALVLNKKLEVMPPMVPGELMLSGEALARCYFGRPALTADRFIPNPFEPNQRLYRTGDKVRVLHSGELEFVERLDFQVKLRGFRIELGEVANAIKALQEIRDAVVVVTGKGANMKLAAFVIYHDEPVDAELLREQLATNLPEYMIPSSFTAIEAIPMTRNGKIDYKALPEPEYTESGRTYEPPQGEMETLVCELWAELLELDQVGRSDAFFELGGHSLLAARFTARLWERAGIEIPMKLLFEYKYARDLAAMIELAMMAVPKSSDTEEGDFEDFDDLEEGDL